MPVVDQSSPVTDVQQAVPVAQEAAIGDRVRIRDDVRRFGGRIGTVERFHEESISRCPIELRLDDGSAYCFRQNELEVLPLPCKSGEGAGAGWIVGSADGKRFRTWMDGWSEWTDVREAATRYARRQDAEAVHMHDEDAWTVVPYTPDATQTREAELVAALERLESANDAVAAATTRERYLTDLADVQPALLELDDARNAARAVLNGGEA